MIESLITIFNRFEEEGQIPLQWRETSIKSLQRRWIKIKNLGKPEGIFITNIVSKAYEIVKKIQNETVQSNMSNIYCRLQKRKTDQQWITSL